MRIPGEILKKYIRFGSPSISGRYLCWLKPQHKPSISVIPISPIKIKEYSNGKWVLPDFVLSWMGPLPVYALDELIEQGDKTDLLAYGIGTIQGAKQNQFKKGPFNESIDTQFESGEAGDYVFELRPNQEPKPTKRWDVDDERWVIIGEKKVKKITKFKRKNKDQKNQKDQNENHFWWSIGTKKQAALGFRGCDCSATPILKKQGVKKGSIIWNCSDYWKIPYPDFVWNGKEWENPISKQAYKIQNIVQRLMDKYEKKK